MNWFLALLLPFSRPLDLELVHPPLLVDPAELYRSASTPLWCVRPPRNRSPGTRAKRRWKRLRQTRGGR